MRRLALCLTLALFAAQAAAQSPATAPASRPADSPPSPAARWIARGESLIAKNPEKPAGYNVKALGLSHLARETGDPADYGRAMDVLQKSFELEPDNFEGLKVKAWVLLGQHRYREARDLAEVLNKRVPDDLYAYAFLSDANVALGDYDAAEKAAQILLDLRPTSVPALTRGAQLRELFGDPEGALELYGKAYQATPADESEERAWTLTQMARVALNSKNDLKFQIAERAVQQAQQEFNHYAPAVAAMADYKEATADNLASVHYSDLARDAAIKLRRQVIDLEPRQPEHWYALGNTLRRARRADDAAQAYARFLELARPRETEADNANTLLIRYLAGPGKDSTAAASLAESELERRHDVETLDAAAVALLAAGKIDEARTAIDRVLAVGVQRADFYFHAGQIAAAQATPATLDEAASYLRRSLELNLTPPTDADARDLLAKVASTAATRRTTTP